jgi:hypothetical protein
MPASFNRSGWGYALGIYECRADARADQSNPLLYEVDWRALQLQFVETAEVSPQVKSVTVRHQRTGLIYPRTDHRHDRAAVQLSRSARLRSAFRARLTAAACSRARFSDGFS